MAQNLSWWNILVKGSELGIRDHFSMISVFQEEIKEMQKEWQCEAIRCSNAGRGMEVCQCDLHYGPPKSARDSKCLIFIRTLVICGFDSSLLRQAHYSSVFFFFLCGFLVVLDQELKAEYEMPTMKKKENTSTQHPLKHRKVIWLNYYVFVESTKSNWFLLRLRNYHLKISNLLSIFVHFHCTWL